MSLKSPVPESERAKYSVGTLTYTKYGLFVLFAWLLWGDFCFQIMESVGGLGIIGLYMMEKLDASMFIVGLLTSTIPMLLGVFLGPIISFKSDRYRSKYGRRIPFMLLTAPFLCFFLVSLGFSDDIYSFLGSSSLVRSLGISHYTATIAVIGFLIGGFAFFNEFVNTVWWYLFADVVPPHFMGRFQGLFRVVNSIAGFFFSALVVQYQLTYMRWVFIGAAMLYFAGFGLMCWRVKEGEYPPVTDVGEKTTLWDKVTLYFRECFTHPIYRGMYASTFFTAIAVSAGMGSSYFLLHVSRHRRAIKVADRPVTAVAMGMGGQAGFAAGEDGSIGCWDLRDGTLASVVQGGHAGPVRQLALADEDRRLISIAADQTLKAWDCASGQELASADLGTVPKALAVAADGSTAAILGQDHAVQVWQFRAAPPGGTAAWHPGQVIPAPPETELHAVSLSSDGTLVATVANAAIILSDVASGRRLGILEDAEGEAAPMKNLRTVLVVPSVQDVAGMAEHDAQDASGRAMATVADMAHTITGFFHDMMTNDTIHQHLPKPGCAVVPDAWVVGAGEDARLHVWDIAAGRKAMVLKGHKKQVNALAYRHDLNLLFSGGSDKMIYAWNLSSYNSKANDNSIRSYAGYSAEVVSLATPAKSDLCLSGSSEGEIHTWNLLGGVTLKQMGILRCLTLILGLVIAYPFGALVDRFHPLRIILITTAIIVPLQLACFFFVVDYWTYLSMEILKTTAFGLLAAGGYPMFIAIFPRDKFGQFCSANGLANQFTRMLAGLVVGGIFMDFITDKKLLADNLRYSYAVCAFGYAGSALCLIYVYRWWKKLGGDKDYAAPMAEAGQPPAS